MLYFLLKLLRSLILLIFCKNNVYDLSLKKQIKQKVLKKQ